MRDAACGTQHPSGEPYGSCTEAAPLMRGYVGQHIKCSPWLNGAESATIMHHLRRLHHRACQRLLYSVYRVSGVSSCPPSDEFDQLSRSIQLLFLSHFDNLPRRVFVAVPVFKHPCSRAPIQFSGGRYDADTIMLKVCFCLIALPLQGAVRAFPAAPITQGK